MFYFKPYIGDLIGLPTSKDHLVFRAMIPGCKILFSVTQQGDVASCHFASNKKGLRILKEVIEAFCDYCFQVFPWCKAIIAKVNKQSVGRILVKLQFSKVYQYEERVLYIRRRLWAK